MYLKLIKIENIYTILGFSAIFLSKLFYLFDNLKSIFKKQYIFVIYIISNFI